MRNKHQFLGQLFAASLMALLLTGCSQPGLNSRQDQPDPTQQPPPESTATPGITPPAAPPLMPAYPGPDSSIDPAMEPLIKIAKADLAKRLGISENEINVVEARAVVWPDASLGCPQPGMAYIQILFEGGLIRLEVAGQVYEYHSGGRDGPFLCEQVGK